MLKDLEVGARWDKGTGPVQEHSSPMGVVKI